MVHLMSAPVSAAPAKAAPGARKRVGVVIGTRPEAIKMAPVVHELMRASREHPVLTPTVFLSGQHRQLLDEALGLFGVEADHDLNVMTGNQQLAAISAQMVTGFD